MARRRIAIVGGGMAGLTAAFELTRTEALRKRFDVTVHQLGWRLGGKCASGVDSAGRDIEHGLHIWFGYYENTFALLEASYAEWQPRRGQRIRHMADAIHRQELTPIGNGDRTHPGWYMARFEPNDFNPGRGEVTIDTWQSLVGTLEVMARFSEQTVRVDGDLAIRPLASPLPLRPAVAKVPDEAAGSIDRADGAPTIAHAARHLRRIARSARQVQWRRPHQARLDLEDIVDSLLDLSASSDAEPVRTHPEGKVLSDLFDVVASFARGIVSDVLLGETPVAHLDRLDFRAWLVRHGARFDAVHESPFVKALYDTMFQYPEGDHSRPLYGAGTAAQVVLRMLGTYAGALAWKLRAGTGQAVIAPLYCVLKKRGVHFSFFHKLADIGLDAQRKAVDTLCFDRQVDLVAPQQEYNPVRMRKGLLSWGAEPDWSAIENGQALRASLAKEGVDLESHWCTSKVGSVALKRGTDFDDAILAIPAGSFMRLNADRSPCAQLLDHNPRFRVMADRQRLVPSISVQARSELTLAELGWESDSPAAVAGPRPLGIWADMSHLLKDKGLTGSLHYFCDVLHSDLCRRSIRERGVPARAAREATAAAEAWFGTHASAIWKAAVTSGTFNWNVLAARHTISGSARLEDQVVHANVDPAGCCISSAPGTTQWRLRCNESGFSNLYLAGSWINTGFNTECIEAAVMSGMQAARAITGEDRSIAGEDFMHPQAGLTACELARAALGRVMDLG